MERNKKNENKRKKKTTKKKKEKTSEGSSLTSSIVIHIAIFCKHTKVSFKVSNKNSNIKKLFTEKNEKKKKKIIP